MRTIAPFPKVDPKPLAAFTAATRAWLARLLVWFATALDAVPHQLRASPLVAPLIACAQRRVIGDLRAAASNLRKLLVASAFARMVRPAQMPALPRYRLRAPAGFKLTSATRFMRRATAPVLRDLHKGALRQRAERLAALLDQFEAAIARVLVRLYAMWRNRRDARLVLVAAPAICAICSAASAPAAADSS